MRSSSTRLLTLTLVALLTGCAENAILELTVTVRDAESLGAGGARRAVLDVFSPDTDAGASLETRPTEDPLEFSLPTTGGVQVYRASVVANGPEVEAPLWVFVRYCGDMCDYSREGDPATLVVYERAFYRGRYTRHELELPPLGAEPTEVGTCEVYGCREGAVGDACVDGRHPCDR